MMTNRSRDYCVVGVLLIVMLLIGQAVYVKIKIDSLENTLNVVEIHTEYIQAIDVSFQELDRIVYFLEDVIEDINSVEIDLMGDAPIIKPKVDHDY